jgi:hypothetical protein
MRTHEIRAEINGPARSAPISCTVCPPDTTSSCRRLRSSTINFELWDEHRQRGSGPPRGRDAIILGGVSKRIDRAA